MSAVGRFKATCEGCGRGVIFESEQLTRDAADAHADECDDLAPDEEVAVEEVGGDD
ncbi:hypothetical protein [Halobacterium litoreum]|uniref:DUF1059 domain-containing protein n=1 Tax=Halobacterium litoreum TaxID=2039234 RepID=A0ABD5NA56_9EURY|nr:hypothetical protein [Halobacterium litoreum]UHH14878.1 hypothetical protein LT972_14825 [Halobacterium litoreum]